MKTGMILFLLCFIVPIISAQEMRTKLIIKTNSGNCYILIDDKLQGRGSLETELENGYYKISIKESMLNWSGNEIIDSVKIDGLNKIVEKKYSIEKQILLNSEPQDAQVIAKDSLIGYTPLLISSSIRNVTLLKNNYAPRNISLGSTAPNKIDLGMPIGQNSGGFKKSIWFKVLLGTAAVLGASAAYYKIEADKKYDAYLINRNSSSLNEVDRLDTISGIALGAFQINFGVLLYFLLFE